MTDEQLGQLRVLGIRAQAILGAYSAALSPFFTKSVKFSPDCEFLIGQLSIRCTMTSDSALLLVGYGKLWDSEVLFRSALEGSLRLLYVCSLKEDEREKRTAEMLHTMPEITRLRRHKRAGLFLNAPGIETEASEWEAIRRLRLSPDEESELLTKYPRKTQIELERRWSLTGLVAELASGTLVSARGLLHSYGMGSHVAHQDGEAVLFMWDREQRDPSEATGMDLRHAARLITDQLVFSRLRTIAVLRTKGLPSDPVLAIDSQSGPLREELARFGRDAGPSPR